MHELQGLTSKGSFAVGNRHYLLGSLGSKDEDIVKALQTYGSQTEKLSETLQKASADAVTQKKETDIKIFMK